jgi:hypothetical protein
MSGTSPVSAFVPAPRRSSPAGVSSVAQVGHAAQQLARALEDARAGFGDVHGTAGAGDQRRADLALQRADLLGHGGGRDVEHARRSGHRAVVHNGHEGVQELGLQGANPGSAHGAGSARRGYSTASHR